MRLVLRNANRFDTDALAFAGETTVICDDGVIVAIGEDGDGDVELDLQGRFLLPGLIDAHVHHRLTTLDFRRIATLTEVEFGIVMARLARENLERGFTTVRDLGGDVIGLVRAIRHGATAGPRIVRSGRMLTQTGGHGDTEGGARAVPDCACQMRHTAFGIVADGVDAVIAAARHNLREGSDFLKIHVSGGVATPSDPLDSIQYTAEEIRAAVVEAEHRHTYVAAHAYSSASIRLAVENGVRCIEHGNLLDADAATAMADHGVTLVPTLSTYEAMDELGPKLGLPTTNQEKNATVLSAGLASLEIARDAGVEMGWGTDLVGESQERQRREFAIRGEVESGADVLRSMFVVNPRLCGLEGRIGRIEVGAEADLVATPVDAVERIADLAHPTAITSVIQAGRVVRHADPA